MKFTEALRSASKFCLEFFWESFTTGLARAAINTLVCLFLMAISFFLGAWFF